MPCEQGVFKTVRGYARAVEKLLSGDCGLVIVRFKDRIAGGGNDFGYRDLMMNVKVPGSDHIGELQLHLPIIDIKPGSHRLYALLRAVGWEEDAELTGEIEDEGSSETSTSNS